MEKLGRTCPFSFSIFIFSFLTIPYLYRYYDQEFDIEAWQTWYRLVTFFVPILFVVYVEAAVRTKKILALKLSWIFGGFSMMLHVYMFVFGMNIPTIVVSQDNMNDALLEDRAECPTLDDIGEAESFLYLTCIYAQLSLEVRIM